MGEDAGCGAGLEGRTAGAPTSGAGGGDLCRRDTDGVRKDRGRDGVDRARLGGEVQRAEHRRALAEIIEMEPTPAIHGVVHWRIVDLCQWLLETFRVTVAKQTLSRELRAMGYRKMSARPRHHAQAAGTIEDCKHFLHLRCGDRRGQRRRSGRYRNLVRRRAPHRSEEQARKAVGQTENAPPRIARPTHRFHLSSVRSARTTAKARRSFYPAATSRR